MEDLCVKHKIINHTKMELSNFSKLQEPSPKYNGAK